jgi:predicted ester cyclase
MKLAVKYEAYIACVNARELDRLNERVSDAIVYNGSSNRAKRLLRDACWQLT